MNTIERTVGTGGAVDGYGVTCGECGMRLTNTVESNLNVDYAAHVEYHERKDGI